MATKYYAYSNRVLGTPNQQLDVTIPHKLGVGTAKLPQGVATTECVTGSPTPTTSVDAGEIVTRMGIGIVVSNETEVWQPDMIMICGLPQLPCYSRRQEN